MLSGIIIHEREDGGYYEAWAVVNGVLYHKDIWRDAVRWPYEYKLRAHEEIRALVAAGQDTQE